MYIGRKLVTGVELGTSAWSITATNAATNGTPYDYVPSVGGRIIGVSLRNGTGGSGGGTITAARVVIAARKYYTTTELALLIAGSTVRGERLLYDSGSIATPTSSAYDNAFNHWFQGVPYQGGSDGGWHLMLDVTVSGTLTERDLYTAVHIEEERHL